MRISNLVYDKMSEEDKAWYFWVFLLAGVVGLLVFLGLGAVFVSKMRGGGKDSSEQ